MEKGTTHILAGSILLAALLWLSVTLGDTYTTRLTVPLSLAALPADLAVEGSVPRQIELELEGQGWQLLFLTMGNRLTLELPASAIHGDRLALGGRLLTGALKLPQGVRVLQAFPDALSIEVHSAVEKKVPVRVNITGLAFRDGFGQTGPIYIEPDSVLLRGSARVLSRISSWPTEPRSFSDVNSPVQETLMLLDSLPGIVRTDVDRIRFIIPVEQTADVRYNDVPVEVQGVPPGRDVLLAHSRVSIVVRGGVQTLAQLSSTDFHAVIEYATVESDTTGTLIPVIKTPVNLTVLQIDPPSIKYTVRK